MPHNSLEIPQLTTISIVTRFQVDDVRSEAEKAMPCPALFYRHDRLLTLTLNLTLNLNLALTLTLTLTLTLNQSHPISLQRMGSVFLCSRFVNIAMEVREEDLRD